ncbi:L-histidine N(alpha)-methyltransferase [Arsukibacterium indicum]|uniref:L-histidine N(Alpha)-methyltransferase n=1 Tax=Arsukibacterium indicum TaxID=2848612 RepID=A0ABS6MJL0_9GAMM|nr:L-histidine N(alpha)-methyltransferase [Arsukibacterium indicum]MBV2128539.1 L-histidine N(alpha)-methyltransferase [Arsukibacterium indicum]
MSSAQSMFYTNDLTTGLISPLMDLDFADDVLTGLALPQKQLHAKYFYDQQGSDYFDQICQLPEYYPYQTELNLLPKVAKELAGILTSDCTIVEFGAGSLVKIKPLLNAINSIRQFIPIDISGIHLEMACQQLQTDFPKLAVKPVVADFCYPVTLPAFGHQQKIGFFPGSTIGNFCPAQAASFLENARCTLGPDSSLLIGVDTKKSPVYLHRAYNDADGITARFNRNILTRINRELGANFKPENFEHYAFYNAGQGRVEMHLVSTAEQVVDVFGSAVAFAAGESIHTENSYKYTPDEFCQLARSAGWQVERTWLADKDLFAAYLLRNPG